MKKKRIGLKIPKMSRQKALKAECGESILFIHIYR